MKLYTKKLFLAILLGVISIGINAQSVWTNANANNNWHDAGNWLPNGIPTAADDVVFNGAVVDNCTLNGQGDCNNLTIMAGYTGIIDANANAIIVSNDFSQADGTLDINFGTFQVVGNSTISGGLFNSNNASSVDFSGNYTLSGGTFNCSSSVLTFAGTFGQSAGTFNGNTSNISITGITTISGTSVFNGNTCDILIGDNFNLTGGTFNSTSSVFTTQGNSFSTSGGTFNANGGTILVQRTTTAVFTISGAFTFNILTLGSSGVVSNKVIDMGTLSTVTTLNLSGGAHAFRYLGNIAVTSALNINGTNSGNIVPNTGIFTFTGAGPFTITGAAAAGRNKLGNITMNNTGNVSMSGHISLIGSWNCTAGIGSFTGGASTLNFYGAAGNINAGTSATTRAYLDNLTINSASTLNVTTGSYVDLNGNFTKTGTGVFTGNTSLFLFTGTGANTIGGSATTITSFNAIAVSKAGAGALTIGTASQMVTLADSMRISGGAVTATNLRLKSTSALKARIAEISGGGSLAGTISVETFIPGPTTDWANLGASGVSGLFFSDWYPTIPMAIEGSATGVTSAGGYFESVWRWDETTAFGYDSTVTVTDAINVGQGYWLFVGTGLSTTADITTTVTGTPVTGAQALPLSTMQAGDCLLANPFASPISWERIYADDPASTTGVIYIYNADAGTTSAYSAITDITTPAGSGANSTIPMGQGFYVVANPGFPSLTISESHKVSNNTGANPLLKESPNTNPSTAAAGGTEIRVKIQDGYGYWDDAAIYFHPSATAAYDNGYDAKKFFSSPGYLGYPGAYTQRTSISTKIGTGDYCINSLPPPISSNAVIPVLAKVYASGQHTISGVSLSNLPPGTCVTLKDKLLNITHNLVSGPYVCNINDTTSTARFELTVCANIALGVNNTPVVTENVFVKQDNNGVYVDLNFEKTTKAIISANNILGQQLMAPKQVECVNGKYYLDLNAKEQIIMVNVIANDKRTTKKIFIQNQN